MSCTSPQCWLPWGGDAREFQSAWPRGGMIAAITVLVAWLRERITEKDQALRTSAQRLQEVARELAPADGARASIDRDIASVRTPVAVRLGPGAHGDSGRLRAVGSRATHE